MQIVIHKTSKFDYFEKGSVRGSFDVRNSNLYSNWSKTIAHCKKSVEWNQLRTFFSVYDSVINPKMVYESDHKRKKVRNWFHFPAFFTVQMGPCGSLPCPGSKADRFDREPSGEVLRSEGLEANSNSITVLMAIESWRGLLHSGEKYRSLLFHESCF